jgi:septin 3/9/12
VFYNPYVLAVLEENGVRLKLTIVDTPGYGDQVNNDHCWDPVIRYVKDQYSLFLRKELTPQREKRLPDSRIHAVLFFISPTGHALSPLDLVVLKRLSDICNVIPVIAKSDSLTPEERLAFKNRIREEIAFNEIRVFPFVDVDEDLGDADRADKVLTQQIKEMIPFAIVGSERNVVVNGKAVRGRRTRWGVVNSKCPFKVSMLATDIV